jgi:hypothetical protein
VDVTGQLSQKTCDFATLIDRSSLARRIQGFAEEGVQLLLLGLGQVGEQALLLGQARADRPVDDAFALAGQLDQDAAAVGRGR